MQRFLYQAEGATDPTAFIIKDDASTVVDLSGYSTVHCLIKLDTGATSALTCTVTDATAGAVTIPWAAGSLVRGSHELTFKLTTSGGDIRLLPGRYAVGLVVRPNIET